MKFSKLISIFSNVHAMTSHISKTQNASVVCSENPYQAHTQQ
jgi:hypothetical protein